MTGDKAIFLLAGDLLIATTKTIIAPRLYIVSARFIKGCVRLSLGYCRNCKSFETSQIRTALSIYLVGNAKKEQVHSWYHESYNSQSAMLCHLITTPLPHVQRSHIHIEMHAPQYDSQEPCNSNADLFITQSCSPTLLCHC